MSHITHNSQGYTFIIEISNMKHQRKKEYYKILRRKKLLVDNLNYHLPDHIGLNYLRKNHSVRHASNRCKICDWWAQDQRKKIKKIRQQSHKIIAEQMYEKTI